MRESRSESWSGNQDFSGAETANGPDSGTITITEISPRRDDRLRQYSGFALRFKESLRPNHNSDWARHRGAKRATGGVSMPCYILRASITVARGEGGYRGGSERK